MKNINLNIVGTEEFISKTKAKIKKGVEDGKSIEVSVRNAVPDSFPEDTKKDMISKIEKYFST